MFVPLENESSDIALSLEGMELCLESVDEQTPDHKRT